MSCVAHPELLKDAWSARDLGSWFPCISRKSLRLSRSATLNPAGTMSKFIPRSQDAPEAPGMTSKATLVEGFVVTLDANNSSFSTSNKSVTPGVLEDSVAWARLWLLFFDSCLSDRRNCFVYPGHTRLRRTQLWQFGKVSSHFI